MVGSKGAFWQALIGAVIIFGFGLILGFFLEENRAESVENILLQSEVTILDEQLRERVSKDFNVSCSLASQEGCQNQDKEAYN